MPVRAGAKLIGQYDAQVSFGQSRALLVWTRLIQPDRKSIRIHSRAGVIFLAENGDFTGVRLQKGGA